MPVVYCVCVCVFQMAASTEGKQGEDEWTDCTAYVSSSTLLPYEWDSGRMDAGGGPGLFHWREGKFKSLEMDMNSVDEVTGIRLMVC